MVQHAESLSNEDWDQIIFYANDYHKSIEKGDPISIGEFLKLLPNDTSRRALRALINFGRIVEESVVNSLSGENELTDDDILKLAQTPTERKEN